MFVEYHENNSGGSFMLTRNDYENLERAGWAVEWADPTDGLNSFVGRVAVEATLKTDRMRTAIDSWEQATGFTSTELGCPCCGPPHGFTLYGDDGLYQDSYSPDYPEYGEPYWD